MLDSQLHKWGAWEQLTVINDMVKVTAGEAVLQLDLGDTARYSADVSHCIRVIGDPVWTSLAVRNG